MKLIPRDILNQWIVQVFEFGTYRKFLAVSANNLNRSQTFQQTNISVTCVSVDQFLNPV